MRPSAPRVLLYCCFLLFSGSVLSGPAWSAQCSDIYPGAMVGPPPEWTFWGDGQACFVRWVPETPEHQDELFERCRNTPDSRFVHFERDQGSGHSICLFKLLDLTPAAADNRPQQRPAVQPPGDALENLKTLVVNWNEDCLAKERSKEALDARACWLSAVEALGGFAANLENASRPLLAQLHELRSAWLRRADQLTGVKSVERVPSVEPAAVREQGPDPHRLAATAHCSSANLGDERQCIALSPAGGEHRYTLNLQPGCETGSIAAIGTLDERGRCVRRVVSLSAEQGPAEIESHGDPRVLDAIRFDEGLYECYARRHENISCDGKIDFSAPPSIDAAVKSKPARKKATARKKKRRSSPAAAVKPQTVRKAASEPAAKAASREPVVRRNYSLASEKREKPKKPAEAGNRKSLSCVLFRKCS